MIIRVRVNDGEEEELLCQWESTAPPHAGDQLELPSGLWMVDGIWWNVSGDQLNYVEVYCNRI